MAREFSGELVFDEMKLKAHGKIVMDALGAAVECLDDSTQLTSLLIGIGERHALYGVQPNMVPVVANFVISKIFFFLENLSFRFSLFRHKKRKMNGYTPRGNNSTITFSPSRMTVNS